MTDAEEPRSDPIGSGRSLRGEVVYLYAFDVANEIKLEGVATLLSGRPAPFTVRADRTAPRLVVHSSPLAIEPAAPTVRLNGEPIRLLVRVYEVGVVNVTVRAAFARNSLVELISFHNPTLDDGRALDVLARELCAEVCRELRGVLVRPGELTEPEAYTVFTLFELGEECDANLWLDSHRREVAGLLAETPPGRLSDHQAEEVLRLRRSFEKTDLVVIDWDAALVVELGGYAEDVLFVLELANLQLEEFRWMDRVLDRHMERAYADLARRRRWTSGSVLWSLRRMRIDLSRLADEVVHATKFVGDWHLARVYLLARERFHLDHWRTSVSERLGQLDNLYTLTRAELYDRRMFWLEIVIVVFFAADLMLILFFKS